MPTYLSPGVYMEEVSSGSKPIEGVGTAVASFVGFAEKGPANEPVLVTNWTQFTQTFGEFIAGSYLAHSVYGYFLNGGGAAYVVRVGAEDGAVPQTAIAELPSGQDGGKPTFSVKALEAGPPGDEITVEIADASEPSDETFKLIVRGPKASEEVYDNLTTKRGPNNVATQVKTSKLIMVEEVKGTAAIVPQKGRFALAGGGTPVPAPEVSANDYVGNSSDRTGFAGLEAIDEITMLCVPDLMAAHQRGMIDEEGVKAVQLAMIAHCELMADRVAILDPPPSLNAQQVKEWRSGYAGYDSRYATLYSRARPCTCLRPAMSPGSGHGAMQPAASTRHRRTKSSVAPSRPSCRSPRASTTSSIRWESTAFVRSPARAFASGAPGRCHPILSGGT